MNVETEVEGAVNERVDRLVMEIDRAIGLIERLRRENAELKHQQQGLQEKVAQQEHDFAALRDDRDRLQTIYEENVALIEKKGEIRQKIEAMLSRLDAVNAELSS